MESSEPENVSWLGVIGKYICFIAFACVFFAIPALVKLLWLMPDVEVDVRWLGVRILSAVVVASGVAFWAGLLFVFRRPWLGTALLILLLIIMFATLPDR